MSITRPPPAANDGVKISALAAFFQSAANIETVLNDQLKKHEVSIVQVIMLHYIRENPNCSGNDIQIHGYFGANKNYRLQQLIKTGLINQTPDEYDGRVNRHTITDSGKQKLDACLNTLGHFEVSLPDTTANIKRNGVAINLR